MQKLTHRIGRKPGQEQSRPDERGFTLAETLFVLTLAAIGIVGAVLLFNAATERMTGNRYSTAMQPFSVDLAQFRLQHFQAIGTAGDSSHEKPYAATQNALATALTTAGECDDDSMSTQATCTGDWDHDGDSSTAVQARVWGGASNKNMQRVMNMPSLVLDSGKWIIRVGQNEDLHAAWAIRPDATALDTGFGFPTGTTLATTGAANTIPCVPAQTAAVFVLAMEPGKGVCDSIADGLGQQDHINEAQCYDANTSPTWTVGNAPGVADKQSAMAICLATR